MGLVLIMSLGFVLLVLISLAFKQGLALKEEQSLTI